MIGKPRKLILLYHSLYSEKKEKSDGYVGHHQSVSVRRLEKQLDWLSQFADFVSLDEIVSIEDPQRWKVAVTFDDGYRNNLSLGLPLFERFQIPVTWFVCTEFVERDRLPWWDVVEYVVETVRSRISIEGMSRPYQFDLSEPEERSRLRHFSREWFSTASPSVAASLRTQLEASVPGSLPSNAFAKKDDVAAAARTPLLSIGGHTVNHPNMARLSVSELRREVERGKRKLQNWTGSRPRWFAYPYGEAKHWDDDAKHIVQKAGFDGAVTTHRAYVHQTADRFEIPRLTVPSDLSTWKRRAWILATNTCRELFQMKQKWID